MTGEGFSTATDVLATQARAVVDALDDYRRRTDPLPCVAVGREFGMLREDARHWGRLSCVVDVTRRMSAKHHTVKLTPLGLAVARRLAKLHPQHVAIAPCPFCESIDVQVDAFDDVFRHVACNVCGARGPREGTEDEDPEHGHDYQAAASRDAIGAWNQAKRRTKRRPRATT